MATGSCGRAAARQRSEYTPVLSTVPDPFRVRLLRIANAIPEEKFTQLKQICPNVQKRELEQMKHPMDLFEKLCEMGYISEEKPSSLQELLTTIGMRQLLNRLQDSITEFEEIEGEVQKRLQLKYKEKYRCVKTIKQSLNMDKLYTSVDVWTDELGVENGERLEDIHQIFDNYGNATRIQLQGAAGTGKSVICKRLAYDWACGSRPDRYNKKIVLLLELRDIATGSEHTSVICEILNQLISKDSKLTKANIAKILENDAESILFLLDGLSEVDKNKLEKSGIVDLIERKMYERSMVVMTTRPYHSLLKDSQSRVINNSLENSLKNILTTEKRW
ncbi:baculoviral IAP repeat-containing protein 1-like [Ptychodera flava]|uniref:baculoviral IAP repeat-containing protein 1-like n=1 Tax=Ptychodera flava TaxID=63121 RepID=UPI003969F6F8